MAEQSRIFEHIYQDYLNQLAGIDIEAAATTLGGRVEGGAAVIEFFGRPFRVSSRGIVDHEGSRPHHAASVVLAKYLLMRPDDISDDEDWVAYRQFKDTAPYAGGFLSTVETRIAGHFSGKADKLAEACRLLGARSVKDQFSHQVACSCWPCPGWRFCSYSTTLTTNSRPNARSCSGDMPQNTSTPSAWP